MVEHPYGGLPLWWSTLMVEHPYGGAPYLALKKKESQ